jgi:hypothetical protein
MHTIKSIMLLGSIVCLSAYPQSAPTDNIKRNADEIFASIMQTMPKEMKMRVDSAKTIMDYHKAGNKNGSRLSKDNNVAIPDKKNNDAALDKLPGDVRLQVQKTMKEIERQQAEHVMEFKENRNKQ